MAKVKAKPKMKSMVAKPTAPDHLTMKLFAPGMSALHRAGLGGLACTLKAMERQFADGRLAKTKLPAPFIDDVPPWEVDEHSITLKFGEPEHAGDYLKKLFEFGFGLRKDGLIFLPGQYDETEASSAIVADLQSGLTLTFLQHGQVRKLEKSPTTVSYDPEADGVPGVIVEYRKCSSFKHQAGWKEFADKNGNLVAGALKVDGPISPGSVVRHVAFTSSTAAEDPPERMLPLYFAMVGCLALSVNRGVAALIVPQVENLLDFIYDRPAMTPTTARDCQIANAADAGFRAQLRARSNPARRAAIQSRAQQVVRGSAIPGCYVMTFTPTPWASQQKSRVATIHVPPSSDKSLDRFERAFRHLAPRIVARTVKDSTGRDKKRTEVERKESFRADSIVRPLVADNLAIGQPWYSRFVDLMTKKNPATDKPFRDQLSFERKGLHAMINDEMMWDDEGEKTIVRAVHEALRCRYGAIGSENQSNKAAREKRWEREYDRWRLAFAGSKSADQFRNAFSNLISRAGSNCVLQRSWHQVLPLLRAKTWQHARDLALLALCSYEGKGEPTTNSGTDSTTKTTK